VTGSGNETTAHLLLSPRMTVMFCAFQGPQMILRLYGTARMVPPGNPEWEQAAGLFSPLPGATQIYSLEVEVVQTSCGMAGPFLNTVAQRDDLNDWARAKPMPWTRTGRPKIP
jgi:hypothetical protein